MEATRTARCRSAVCQNEPSARAMAKTTSFDFILQIEMQTPWNRNGSFYLDIADLNVSLDTGCTPSVWYILDNLSATKVSGSELAAIIAHGEPPVA